MAPTSAVLPCFTPSPPSSRSYDTHVEDKEFHKEADRILEALQDQLDVSAAQTRLLQKTTRRSSLHIITLLCFYLLVQVYLEDNGIEGEVEYSVSALTGLDGRRWSWGLRRT